MILGAFDSELRLILMFVIWHSMFGFVRIQSCWLPDSDRLSGFVWSHTGKNCIDIRSRNRASAVSLTASSSCVFCIL